MAQLDYSLDMEVGLEGQKADSGFDNVLSYRASQDINFGRGLTQGVEDRDAKLPSANVAVLLFDADFVTGNEINLDVNGEAAGPVAFDTDQATTLAALVAAIDAIEGVSASASGAREVTIVAAGADAVVENVAVTGGASQAGSTVSVSSNESFIGVALHTHAIEQNLDGVALYKEQSAVSVLTRGRVYVRVEDAVSVSSSVYLRFIEGGANELVGQFRSDDDSGNAMLISGARFTKGAAAGELAVLEVNLPN